MEVIEFTVGLADEGMRIDTYLSEALDSISRSKIQSLIKEQSIYVDNKKPIKKNYLLEKGDTIIIKLPSSKSLEILPEDISLDIVYQDTDLIVVNKPAGMVVHPAPGNYSGTLVNALLFHVKDLSNIGGEIRPGIVHRIDKDTSGLIMIAKNNLAHLSLSKQLKEHTVTRRYIALVHGGFNVDEGIVDNSIGRNPNNRLKMAISKKNGRRAVTHYKVLERFGEKTLIACILETGRTHQIRVHMASIAHPLVGDPLYGIKKDRSCAGGQFLHAEKLGFIHPTTQLYMQFEQPLPKKMQNTINLLRSSRYGI